MIIRSRSQYMMAHGPTGPVLTGVGSLNARRSIETAVYPFRLVISATGRRGKDPC